ncbi:catecholate siderophore receptor [Parasphingorhabdus marina DSM 22363]|uniref:Catecholate siderophore receptor n=1 Tax=Parasphingorhabdus marina DSM 22363 TaxID=1123272 RepID=A0A1N6CV56_9SPHN|nr:TonB-dependent siderophore receptor [Parasphingorhabdus marina]SIN62392.1 catecholate siderophore receptor [Parasphingorhabdus marina DSM 22363]
MSKINMLSFMLATTMLVPAAAHASDAAADQGKSDILVVGEVLYSDQVNSLKTPTPIIDVPQSLSITTADQIARRGFTSVGQIVDYTPGVNNSQGEGHRDAVVFRGVRSTADFYIDGVRDDVQYYRGLYNLEQVEILRGPNALLFGRGGTGGILNRVTKKGTIGETFGGGQVSLDTFGAFDIQADVNLAAGENVGIRLNAAYESLNNHRDFYDGDRIGINPTVRFLLGERTTFDLSYEYADHERFVDRGIPTGIDGRPVEAFEDIVFGDAELNFTTLEAHLVRANLQHEFSENVKGNFSAFYGDYDKVYSNFYASAYNQLATPDDVTTDGYIDATQRENLILSGNLIGEFDTGNIHHTLIVGGEYINTSSDQNRFNAFWDQTQDDNEIFSIARPLNFRGGVGVNALGQTTTNDFTVDINDDTRVSIDVLSFYIQDEIKLTDWLNIVVGGRFDSFDIEVNNVVASEIRNRKDEEFSPRGGIIIKPEENISIYASYSESFLPRSGEQFANINGNNDALAPNTFTNLEAGIKWDFQPGLSLTAAVFDIEQSSPQPNDNDPATLDVIDSNIQGFELQLQGQVMDGWFISAGYSFLDGVQVDAFGNDGLRPRELPENMFSIWNQVQVTERFGIGVGLTHQSESFITNGNVTYTGLNGDTVTTRAILPSYTRIDAAAYYDVSENLRLQVNVENVTDTLYFPTSHSTHQASVGAPLNARFTISGRF